jgi:hypothetical protein
MEWKSYGRGRLLLAAFALLVGACAADASPTDATGSEPGDDGAVAVTTEPLASGTLRLNDVYYVRASTGFDGARMFSTATSSTVVRRLPPQAAVKIVTAAPSSERYRVDHAGTLGWIAGADLTLRHRYDAALSATRINALARARVAMGFSYWWSNAKWPKTGATMWPTKNKGSCSGVCGGSVPCTHAATGGGPEYGADCSGFVSTIWGFPDTDSMTNPTNNGYDTQSYSRDTTNWTTIPISSARAGDAAVTYSKGGRQHIVLIATTPTARGLINTYECSGCSAGCRTYTLTITADSAWHVIRRKGW